MRPAPAVPAATLPPPALPGGTVPMERLAAAVEALEGRFRVSQQLQARTPIYVRETGYQASGTSLSLTPATSQPEVIESIVVSVAGAGTLTLAETVIPIPGVGVYIIAPVQILLNPSDIRSLSVAAAGALSLTLTGHQLPQWGNLS